MVNLRAMYCWNYLCLVGNCIAKGFGEFINKFVKSLVRGLTLTGKQRMGKITQPICFVND